MADAARTRTVLVTAAMGNQGRLLIPKLAAAGWRVRAYDHRADPAMLDRLGAAEAVRADLLDTTALAHAMSGCAAVYHLNPNTHPAEERIGLNVIAAGRTAAITHLVFGSVLHPQIAALAQHAAKLRVLVALVESDLDWTVLAPAHYMQTLQHRAAFAGGPFQLNWSLDRRQTLVDLDDVTDVAARVIDEGPRCHAGATYELCSASALTAREIAGMLGDLLGRGVEARRVSPGKAIRQVFGGDGDAATFAARVRLFESTAGWYDAHDFIGAPTVLRCLLGREPTDLGQFLARDLAAWRADQSGSTPAIQSE